MSGSLVCDGVFQVPLLDGWHARGEPGRTYELAHETLEVGVNISVLPRDAVGDDIVAAVHRFATHCGAEIAEADVVQIPADDHARAFARYDVEDRTWLAGFVYLGPSAVLISSNSTAGDEAAFRAGELVVAALGPIVPD